MPYQVRVEHKPNTLGLDDRIWVLDDGQGGCVEIWPARGFNAYRWRTPQGHEILYADPKFFEGDKPTKSGIPILFPFPNRIRDGRFSWEGKDFQLPLNDPAGKNAIHGFVCDRPWRVVKQGANDKHAWLTGEFHCGADAPYALEHWPADYCLRVTYCIREEVYEYWRQFHFEIKAEVQNPTTSTLPFGLGYHPYFYLAPFRNSQSLIHVPLTHRWRLANQLPTHELEEVLPNDPLRTGSAFESLYLDDLYTGFKFPPDKNWHHHGRISAKAIGRDGLPVLHLHGQPDFRELVVFTPAHRQAICLEPYTCPTDAINLTRAGVECGWKVLKPGHRWQADLHWVFGSIR